MLLYFFGEGAEKQAYLLGLSTFAQVIITGIEHQRTGMRGNYQPLEMPGASGQRGSTKAKIDRL